MIFQNKIAIVTGGGSGIGRATAIALARQGATIVIGNRNREQGDAVVREIRGNGGSAEFLRTDVSKLDDIKALIDHAVTRFGKLDLAFNNAGMDGVQKILHEQDEALLDSLIDIHIKGVFWAMKYEIVGML